MFTNGPGDRGSILGRVKPKTQKLYLIPPCNQQYKVRIKYLYKVRIKYVSIIWYLLAPSNIRYVSRVKWSNPGKRVAPSPTPRYSSYWKGSLLVANFTLYIYIYIYIKKLFIFLHHAFDVFRRLQEDDAKRQKHVDLFILIYIYIYIYIYIEREREGGRQTDRNEKMIRQIVLFLCRNLFFNWSYLVRLSSTERFFLKIFKNNFLKSGINFLLN